MYNNKLWSFNTSFNKPENSIANYIQYQTLLHLKTGLNTPSNIEPC